MSLAIPADELSTDAKRNARMVTRRRLIELMIASGKAQNAKQVTTRMAAANDDFSLTNGTENNEWVPAAGTAGTDLNYINAVSLGNNKYFGVYAFADISAAVRPHIATWRFRIGTSGANVLAELAVAHGYAYENKVWYLDDPIIYQPTDLVTVTLEVALSWSVGQLVAPILGYIAEPSGQSVM